MFHSFSAQLQLRLFLSRLVVYTSMSLQNKKYISRKSKKRNKRKKRKRRIIPFLLWIFLVSPAGLQPMWARHLCRGQTFISNILCLIYLWLDWRDWKALFRSVGQKFKQHNTSVSHRCSADTVVSRSIGCIYFDWLGNCILSLQIEVLGFLTFLLKNSPTGENASGLSISINSISFCI